ncbi:facilitated trehalose transporter Tret1 [Calliopsis andreniformis]|uniref:facilitated trehalose transporter Tret1 n=1 Tax=Calliopsis andreniformis TaxID=337506 RepID=UPI003FCD7E40
MISYGLFFGWSSPSLPLLMQHDSPIHLTLQQATWVTSILHFGAVVGIVFCTCIINVIGRKWTIFLTVVPAVIGWLIIAFATSVWELYVGRIILGLSSGNGYISVVMYIGEISPAKIRGVLTSMLTVSTKIGMLLGWIIGPFLSFRDLPLVSLTFPILFLVCMIWLPESPYHLMRRGKHQEAINSLSQLRGTMAVSEETEIIEKTVKVDLANDTGLWELLSVSGNRRALIVVLGLGFFQQWSGSMAIISYTESIFNATNNEFEGKYVTMIVGGVQVACAIASTIVVDRYSRRSLLMLSTSGTCFSTTLVGLFFYLQSTGMDTSGIVWLPAIGVIMYIVTYAFGLAGLPYTMISEIFPTNVKALGSACGILCCNLLAFIVIMFYPIIVEDYGAHVSFWIFSAITLLGTIFVYIIVPETKGRTLQEVQEQLHGRKLF